MFEHMPSIKIEKQVNKPASETFKRISDLLSNDKDLRKLDAKYKADFNPATMSGTAEGSMFKANLNVKESSGGSTVAVTVDLPMTLMLMKGMVEKTLQKKLDEALA